MEAAPIPEQSRARRLATVLLAALGIQACMSAPRKPDAGAAVVPVADPAAVAADSGAEAAEPEAVAAASATTANPYPGMTERIRPDGTKVYCRKEIATGERIAKERCYTEYAMRQLETQRRDFERSRATSAYGTSGGGPP